MQYIQSYAAGTKYSHAEWMQKKKNGLKGRLPGGSELGAGL